MIRSLIGLATTVISFLVMVCAAGVWGVYDYHKPGPLAEPVTLIIPKAQGMLAVSAQLADAGVIDHKLVFMAGVEMDPEKHYLKAGEYAFPAHISKAAVEDMLSNGKVVLHKLTVPEGLTSAQIVALVKAEPALSGDIAQIPPEGSLLPETYDFARDDSRAGMLKRMSKAMSDVMATLWAARSPDVPFKTPEEAVTLASVVEKETGVAAERPMVASVFVNRLRLGMPLQSDPTVIYALTNGAGPLGRSLTHADLQIQSPYNTYVIYGLPPTPIANPGKAALVATLQPQRTSYLYFVANGTGGHAFAATLEEHNRNVEAWRDMVQQQQAQQGQPHP